MNDVSWLQVGSWFFDRLFIPLLGYGAYVLRGMYAQLRSIDHQLRLLNGRVIRLETWQVEHERHDDERTEMTNNRIDHIVTSLEAHPRGRR